MSECASGEVALFTCHCTSPAMAPELLAQIPRDTLAQPVRATTSSVGDVKVWVCVCETPTLQSAVELILVAEVLHKAVVSFPLSSHLSLK